MADREFRVVVAGAGVSGLFMAETLKRARIDFAVYEKASEVGGTWRDNTFPGLLSMSCPVNTSFRSSPTTTGRANMRPPPRSGPTSRRLRTTGDSPNSSGSTRRSSLRGLPTVVGASRRPRATPRLPTSLSVQPAFSTSRSFLKLRGARASQALLFTRRAGITACPMRTSAGASSAAALARFSHTGSDFRAAAAGRITEGLKERGL